MPEGFDVKAEARGLGLSLKDLAGMVDVSQDTMSRISQGHKEPPRWLPLLLAEWRRAKWLGLPWPALDYERRVRRDAGVER